MPEIINSGDSEALVKLRIIDILNFHSVSSQDILSWGTATIRLNQAASKLGFSPLENRDNGAIAREKINALATSPAAVLPENTSLPVVSGNAEYQSQLQTTTGEWNAYPAATYTFKWKADGVEIPDATSSTFTIGIDQIGKVITSEVTATNLSGERKAESLPTEIVVSAPANSTPPSISGSGVYNEPLTAANGVWAAYPLPIEYSYQWKVDGVNINGAITNTYTPVISDIGKQITVEVTAQSSEGQNVASSAPTNAIQSSPINTQLPVVSGYLRTGEVITASNGNWAAFPLPLNYSYQWLADGVAITGATSSTFTLTDNEAGKEINVTVQAQNSVGSNFANSSVAGRSEPSWVPRGSDSFLDFENDRKWNKSSGIGNIASEVTFTRTSNAWDLDDSSNLYIAPANTLRLVSGRGALLEPQQTNQIRNASAVGGSAGSPGSLPTNWGTSGGSGGTATGVTRTLSYGDMNGFPGMFIRFQGTATNGPAVGYNFDGLSQIAVASGQTWHGAAYIALTDGSLSSVSNITFRSARGSSSSGGTTGDTGQMTIKDQLDSTLRRFGMAHTISDVNTVFAVPQLLIQFTTGNVYDFTLFIAAPSFIQAAFSASPILSSTASLTRAADFLRSDIDDGGKAFLVDFDLLEPISGATNRRIVSFGASAGNEIRMNMTSTGTFSISSAIGGVAGGGTPSIAAPSSERRIGFGVFDNGYARMGFAGGLDGAVSTSVQVPSSISRIALAGQPHASGNNTAMNVRKFAQAPVSEFSSPADAYEWAKSVAQGWL